MISFSCGNAKLVPKVVKDSAEGCLRVGHQVAVFKCTQVGFKGQLEESVNKSIIHMFVIRTVLVFQLPRVTDGSAVQVGFCMVVGGVGTGVLWCRQAGPR